MASRHGWIANKSSEQHALQNKKQPVYKLWPTMDGRVVGFYCTCLIYCLHIYDTMVSLSTDIPLLYNVVVKYCHTIVYSTGKHCIVAINEYKGKFHFIIYFKKAIVFIVSSTAGSSCCSVLCLFHIFAFEQPNPTLFSLFSHIAFLR